MKYVTKYVLTKGILCAEDYEIVEDEYLSAENKKGSIWVEPVFWHHTREQAQKKAEILRKNKINNLRKQLSKLEAYQPKFVNYN